MSDMRFVKSIAVLAVLLGFVATGRAQMPTLGPGGTNARYATDAYPGFDSEDDNLKPERKEPHWWWFMVGGPSRENAADEFAYCQGLVAEGSYSKACRELDNLVRQWPTAPEAWKAQQLRAELLLERMDDPEESFKAYQYLLDFYSLSCDYSAIADRLYEIAGILKLEGKEVMFVRFANTVDVRRAYEKCILRAPGAKWVPEAMLIIAGLREDEGKFVEAVKVYENLRNLHSSSEQAKTAIAREAAVRMQILRDREYNRARSRDTADFLRLALRTCRPDDAAAIQGYLGEVTGLLDEEAYRSAKFYDSTTRTKRSAIAAYEQFLKEHPLSPHADEIRARIEELKGEGK